MLVYCADPSHGGKVEVMRFAHSAVGECHWAPVRFDEYGRRVKMDEDAWVTLIDGKHLSRAQIAAEAAADGGLADRWSWHVALRCRECDLRCRPNMPKLWALLDQLAVLGLPEISLRELARLAK